MAKNWLCYLQIAKDNESRFINRKSNFMQFTNHSTTSLKFINRDSRSKVKSGIYKSQIRKSVIYKLQMLYINHKRVIYKSQMLYINRKSVIYKSQMYKSTGLLCFQMPLCRYEPANKFSDLRFNKLTSVFYASVLLLIMNFVITLSK